MAGEEVPWRNAVWIRAESLVMLIITGFCVEADFKETHAFVISISVNCYLCAGGIKTNTHLFLHCHYSR